MARFDVYANPSGLGYLLDLQASLLEQLNTRIVAPLWPLDVAPVPAGTLNPLVEVNGVKLAMVTQFMAAVPRSELRSLVANLDSERVAILAAIDFVHQGW